MYCFFTIQNGLAADSPGNQFFIKLSRNLTLSISDLNVLVISFKNSKDAKVMSLKIILKSQRSQTQYVFLVLLKFKKIILILNFNFTGHRNIFNRILWQDTIISFSCQTKSCDHDAQQQFMSLKHFFQRL